MYIPFWPIQLVLNLHVARNLSAKEFVVRPHDYSSPAGKGQIRSHPTSFQHNSSEKQRGGLSQTPPPTTVSLQANVVRDFWRRTAGVCIAHAPSQTDSACRIVCSVADVFCLSDEGGSYSVLCGVFEGTLQV